MDDLGQVGILRQLMDKIGTLHNVSFAASVMESYVRDHLLDDLQLVWIVDCGGVLEYAVTIDDLAKAS